MRTQSISEPQMFPAVQSRSNWLMCFPEFYDVQYIINPWMEGNLHASSRMRAIDQWRSLYSAISRSEQVELISPQSGLPDMVFTANAGLERDGIVVCSRFLHTERRAEEAFFRKWFQKNGYTIIDLPQEIAFEGEGDALFSNDGNNESILWAGYGMRTDRRSHTFLEQTFSIKVISLHLVDPRFYHLDTCFAPLKNGYLLYYPPAFDSASLGRIHSVYPPPKRIPVSENDAFNFACNAISIDHTIVVNEISSELKEKLKDAGFRVMRLQLDEFLKAGGAAKCLVMKLCSPAREIPHKELHQKVSS
jgi:ornithine--oxo-acid transaminase